MTGSMEEEGMSMNTEPVTKGASEQQPGDEVKMSNWPVIERQGFVSRFVELVAPTIVGRKKLRRIGR